MRALPPLASVVPDACQACAILKLDVEHVVRNHTAGKTATWPNSLTSVLLLWQWVACWWVDSDMFPLAVKYILILTIDTKRHFPKKKKI